MFNPMIKDLSDKSLDDLLKTSNDLHKKIAFAGRMGNANMINQLRNTLNIFQQEINKRYQQEAQAAKENPIFKDSLDIG
jgi:hypothetical protein